jgi:PAS domain S-box-containing protein
MTEASSPAVAFHDFAAVFPEPHWILLADGTIVAVNPAAAALAGRPAPELAGAALTTLVSEEPGHVVRYLAMCARSREMVPGAFTLRAPDGEAVTYRCDGAVLRPYSPDAPALILVRWRPRETTTSRFVTLTERIEALNREILRREEAERVLRQQAGLLEQTYDAIFVWALDGGIVYFNRAAEELYGWSRAEVLGRRTHDLLGTQVAGSTAEVESILEATGRWTGELVHTTRHGRHVLVESRMVLLRAEGAAPLVLETTRDVTENRRARSQLEAAQRLEAVGRLAGGVAHEINNALQGAMGFSAFALSRLAPHDPVRDDVQQALKASERAAAITRGLLAFSRRQVLQPSSFDLRAIVEDFTPMLRRALARDQELRLELPPAPVVVHADRGQIEQVLLNFVLNARDAMGTAGQVVLRVSSARLSRAGLEKLGRMELMPGLYACLEVSDTGHGMDEATLSHIFEPFYTTKPVGQGTGLGLPVAHGIIHQSGGAIAVRSAPGQGTTFTVYLPALDEEPLPAPTTGVTVRGGSERILVVDDEAVVVRIASRILQQEGYTVLAAGNGAEALLRIEQLEDGDRLPVDLVLTDVIMPVMAGRELGEFLAGRYPGLPVLYTSGHPGENGGRGGRPLDGAEFIQKPFQPGELLLRVRALLDRPPAP